MTKILIAVGGTGGHVIPARALAQDLIENDAHADILFVGGNLTKNTYLDDAHFVKSDITSPKLSLRYPLKSLLNLGSLYKGIKESKKIIEKYNPDVIVGFGSYHTFPMMMAAAMLSRPIALYAADTIPGKVVRFMSSFATVSTIHFQGAEKYLRGYKQQVRHPIRHEYALNESAKAQAYDYFGFTPQKNTILVFGGSQGADFINRILKSTILGLQDKIPSFQVIHITGSLKWTEEMEVFYKRHGIKAFVKEYETRMDLAWQIADMSISRAGASTIAEQIAMEVPGILIPYPSASDNHQNNNADFMAWDVGCAVKLLESKATEKVLIEKIVSFFAEDKALIKKFKKHMQVYKENRPEDTLASIVYSIAKRKSL